MSTAHRRSNATSSPTAPAPREPRVLSFSQKLSKWDLKISPYLYISPFFILFGLVGLFPIGYTLAISFMEWDMVRNTGTFSGFDQYVWVLSQPAFWDALRNTFSIFLLSSVPQIFAALFIAAVLDKNIRAKTFWRMGVLVPYVVAPVAVALIFNNLFADRFGLVNQLIESVGLSPIGWHVDSFASHIAIATMVNFRWTGYNALILLAAMQAVNREYYEAATVDGAGPIRQFWSITLPSLKPTLIFVIITSTIGGLQIFDEPRMFDNTGNGGAANQWLTITLYLYKLGWADFDLSRAAALAWILFLLILAVSLINLLLTRRALRDDVGPRASRAERRETTRQAKELIREQRERVAAISTSARPPASAPDDSEASR